MRGMNANLTIGERIRYYRTRRGTPQDALAGLVGRSEDWLSKVENNRLQVDRLSVLRRLALALDVSIGDLVGEPTLLNRTSESCTHTVPALRTVLMDYRQLNPLLASSTSHSGEPPCLDALRQDIEDVFEAYQDSRYGYVTSRIPLVLTEALQASHSAKDTERGQGLLALAYQSAAGVLTKLGETDLAWIASERGLTAAQQSREPLILGSLLRSVTHALHSTERFHAAVQLTEAAGDILQPYLCHRDDENLLSIYGSLFLTGSVAASRAADRQATTAFLSEAQVAANRMGRDANRMWTAFGPTNVAIHRVTAAIELGDVQIALDLSPRIDPSHLPVERQVRHAIETARVYSSRNRRDDALDVLLDAEVLAPEQVKHHAISRQLVVSWLRNHRGPRNTRLDLLARRLHLVE